MSSLVKINDPRPLVPPPPSGSAAALEEVDLREYFLFLRRRWPAVLVVAAAVFGFMARNTLKERKVYEASTKLVVVTKNGFHAVGASSQFAGGLEDIQQARAIDTQVEIITSPDLIDKAYASLSKVDKQKGYDGGGTPGWGFSVAGGKADTDVITITGKAYDPIAAAHFANAIAETYLSDDLSRNGSATRQAREYVQRERDRTGVDLGSAAAKLADFKRQTGLVAAGEQASSLAKTQIDLRNAYDTAKGETVAARKRLEVVQRQIKVTAPEVSAGKTVAENPEFGLVRGQIVVLEGKLTEMAQEYTPSSLEITQLRMQIREQRDALKNISQTIVSSRTTSMNPLREKLITDYAEAEAGQVVAAAHTQALGEQIARMNKELNGYPGQERRLAELQQRVDVLSRTFNMLSDRYYSLLIDERSNLPSGMIAARARPAGGPSSPQVGKALTTAGFLALILGLAAGLLLEKLDTKAHNPVEVEKLYDLTSLALIPEASSTEGASERLVIGRVAPNHAFTEGFRLLRNNIGFLSPDDPIRVVGVTSATMGEGKSTTSVNLAIAMAMDGKRVLLVDADLRRPTIHKWMGLSNEVGFSSVVRGLTPLLEAIHETPYEGVSCLTSGPLPPDPTEFLNSERSHELLRQAKDLYDVVIVDAPPCTGLSDTQIISTMVDGVLVVAALDKTPKPLMTAAIRMLRQANANVLGLVINRMKQNSGGYGYYGYYGYSSYEADAPSMNGRSKGSQKGKGLAKR